MDPIVWDVSLETKHSIVDEQHRAIFGAFNRLLKAMSQGKGKQEVENTLAFLKDYTIKHFNMEEALMERYRYPEQERHKVLHREFVAHLADMVDRHRKGASVTISLMQFVKDWLLNHIQVEDMRLAQFILSR